MMLVGGGLALVFVAGGFVLAKHLFWSTKPGKTETTTAQVQAQEELFARFSDGVMVAKADLPDHWYAVMVENSKDAWPLSGLEQARLVIEAPVEASIPRFMAFFDNKQEVKKIGPVRSARPYYLDWASGFNAMYAHVGGSPEALDMITQYHIPDLNQFFWGDFFWRDDARQAPHNVYTTTQMLEDGEKKRSYDLKISESFFAYAKEEASPEKRGNVTEVKVPFLSAASDYDAVWKFEPEQNAYRRFQAEQETKTLDGDSIFAKNVLVLKMPITVIDSAGRRKILTAGGGKGTLYRDGLSLPITWKKDQRKTALAIFDDKGEKALFNAGSTWIEVVDLNTSVVEKTS